MNQLGRSQDQICCYRGWVKRDEQRYFYVVLLEPEILFRIMYICIISCLEYKFIQDFLKVSSSYSGNV